MKLVMSKKEKKQRANPKYLKMVALDQYDAGLESTAKDYLAAAEEIERLLLLLRRARAKL